VNTDCEQQHEHEGHESAPATSPALAENAKPAFDLRIQLDAQHRILHVSWNEADGVPLPATSATLQRPGEPQPALGAQTAHGGHSAHPGPTVAEAANTDLESTVRTGKSYLLHLLRNTMLTLGSILALQWLAYRVLLNRDPTFLDRYGWWILYLDISVVALVATLGYLRSYLYANANHMVGMMIGMTIGMQVGAMIGGVLGATNGFFVGSMVGMTLGSLYGVVTAWRCGPMAVMHGLMSGVMGGTMGAMVVMMMLPDHVLVFMPLFTTANLLILVWFSRLFYQECVIGARCQMDRPMSLLNMLGVTTLTVGFLTALMVAGPKGPMVWTGQKRPLIGDEPTGNPFSLQDGAPTRNKAPGEMSCGGMMGGMKQGN
jgi:hypothetical protein